MISMALVRRIVERIVVRENGELLYVIFTRSDLYGTEERTNG